MTIILERVRIIRKKGRVVYWAKIKTNTKFVKATKNRKEFIVARNKGKIESMREATKIFGLAESKAKYSTDNTLSDDVKIFMLTNVKETTNMRKGARSPVKSYQVVASIQLHGQTVIVRSDKRVWQSISDAKQNALEHLYGTIAVAETGESDKAVGESIAKDIGGIHTGIVYYTSREQATA